MSYYKYRANQLNTHKLQTMKKLLPLLALPLALATLAPAAEAAPAQMTGSCLAVTMKDAYTPKTGGTVHTLFAGPCGMGPNDYYVDGQGFALGSFDYGWARDVAGDSIEKNGNPVAYCKRGLDKESTRLSGRRTYGIFCYSPVTSYFQ